jgi:hypothetical protein
MTDRQRKIARRMLGLDNAGQDALIRYHCDLENAVRFLESDDVTDLPHPLRRMAARRLRQMMALFDSCEEGKMKREEREPVRLEVAPDAHEEMCPGCKARLEFWEKVKVEETP